MYENSILKPFTLESVVADRFSPKSIFAQRGRLDWRCWGLNLRIVRALFLTTLSIAMQRRQFSLGFMAATAMPLYGAVPLPATQTAATRPPARGTNPSPASNALPRAAWVWPCSIPDRAWRWAGGKTSGFCHGQHLLVLAWLDAGLGGPGQGSLAGCTCALRRSRRGGCAFPPVSGERAGDGGLTVGELCAATVSLSDNTAANVLLARHGGPAGFTAFVRSLGDEVTRLDRTEPTLNEAAVGDPRDTTTPLAMLQTLQKLVLGNALSPTSRAWLQRWLEETSTGDNGCAPVCRAGRWATRQARRATAARPTTSACCARAAAHRCW